MQEHLQKQFVEY